MRKRAVIAWFVLMIPFGVTVASAGDIDSVISGNGLIGRNTDGPNVRLDVGAGPGISVSRNRVAVSFAGMECPDRFYVGGFDPWGAILCRPLTPSDFAGYDHVGYLDGHQYYLSQAATDWHSAQAFCGQLGGHLMTASNIAENTIGKIAAQSSGGSVWLGYSDEAVEGDWAWVTGESETYTDWHAGQPNDTNAAEDCAAYYDGFGWQWNDKACASILAYLCELEP